MHLGGWRKGEEEREGEREGGREGRRDEGRINEQVLKSVGTDKNWLHAEHLLSGSEYAASLLGGGLKVED